jgi:hypothetical protein
MEKIKIFLRRLSSPRNILPIVVIVGAIIGVFNLEIFGTSAKSEQIIMALLGFLAIDALVERLDLLTNIEQGITSIRANLSPRVQSDFFLQKKDFGKVEKLIQDSEYEIWIYGVTLDGLVTLANLFREKLGRGCKIRVLAPDPDGLAFQETARYFGSRPEKLAMRLRNNLENLLVRFKQVPNGSFEIHLLDRVLTSGYVISEPKTSRGKALIRLYSYWYGVENAPTFELSSQEDVQWYPVFLSQFDKAWEHSKSYEG